jgi:integrase
MPKKVSVSLSDVKIKNSKPREKDYKLFDGDGLFLLVTSTGGKLWRLKYRFDGKEKTLALGKYPVVTLMAARERRMEAKRKLDAGIDPVAEKKAEKADIIEQTKNTFDNIAREWHSVKYDLWTKNHAEKLMRSMEANLFPVIGSRPIKLITAMDILEALRIIESRGAIETAHRVKTIVSQVFRYAVSIEKAERDPTINLTDSLQPVIERHYAAVTEPVDVAGLLKAIDGYKGTFTVKSAMQLAPLVFVRPGELRKAEWTEFNLEEALWTIPAERMKMRKSSFDTKKSHVVPLSFQAVKILKELYLFTGNGRFVFPSARSADRPMSNNAVLAALRRMGFEKDEMSGHGFRAMARTILDEVLQVRPDFIEAQLAHVVRDPLRGAYNRSKHIEKRKEMMQTWADYLDGLKSGAKIIPFRKSGTMD